MFLGRYSSSCATLLALAAVSHAQIIEVPDDFADVQDAIDAADPGSTILVHGGTYGSITIDKSLTLIGPALFEGSAAGSTWQSPIVLAGPGSGVVILSDVSTGIEFVNGASQFSSVSPGISGAGFDELHVYDSEVRAPSFCSFGGGPGCLLSGVGVGKPGIQANVPLILIERSLVQGSRSDNDGGMGYPDGPAGIHAPGSTVIALDSTVRGGPSGNYFAFPSGNCATLCFGSGGPAVVAATLFDSRTTLTGGAGATWHGRDSEFEPYVLCGCTGPAGAAAAAETSRTQLRGTLEMPSPPVIGTDLMLVHRGGRGAILLQSSGLGSPVRQPMLGLLFLESPTTFGTIDPGTVLIPIPAISGLIGTELAFQTIEMRVGLSRPVSGVIR